MLDWSKYLKNVSLFESAFHKSKLICTIMRYAQIGSRLLETGFGSGKTAILLSDLGYEVTAIDIDDELLSGKTAETAKEYGITIKKENMIKTNFRNSSFDIVFHQGVLEHFNDKDIKDALRENGRIGKLVIFHVPNSRLKRQPYGNERCLSISKWKRLISESGLDLIETIGDQPNKIFHIFLPHILYTRTFSEKIFDIPSKLLCRSSIFVARKQ